MLITKANRIVKTQILASLASPIVLFHQVLEEYVGTEASELASRLIHALSTRKLLENGLAHLMDDALNLAVFRRRNVYN